MAAEYTFMDLLVAGYLGGLITLVVIFFFSNLIPVER